MLTKAPQSIWLKLTLVAVATALAVFFGLIGVTANPIFTGLAVGMVMGTFLLAIPKQTIVLVIVLGLATPALLDMAGHGLSRMLWAISMLGLLLWVPSMLNLVSLNPNKKQTTPLFIWIAVIFAVYAVVSTGVQMYSVGELFGGFKRYFQAFGLMLALATMPLIRKDFDQWLKIMFGLALLQLPFAAFERVVLVAIRGGVQAGGGQATDVVAGTMGANLDGGSPNSIMVTFVIIAFSFLISRWKEKLVDTSSTLILSSLLLAPLLLGETKVVVLMLPLMVLVLLRNDIIREPLKYIPIIAVFFIVTVMLMFFYVYYMLDSTLIEALDDTLAYNVQEGGYGTSLLNRTTVMTFWWGLHGWHDPVSFLFGHGLGSSYGSGLDAGHIAQFYPSYGINLTTVSSLLWDLGVVGFILYLSIYVIAWLQIGQVWKQTKSQLIKADCVAIQSSIALTLLFIIYSDSQVNLLVHEIIIAFVLGYAAFICKEHRQLVLKISKL